MTTATWTTKVRHDSDAEFRAWGAEFASYLATVGLVQTADTGQIDWTTVTRPAGTNTNAGYEIWRFNDTMQASSPVYIRFDYGNASSTSTPRIQAQIGTGSNGSGTLTGANTTRTISVSASASFDTNTTYPSYMCYANGCFSFFWKIGRISTATYPIASMILTRTTDSDGDLDAVGLWWIINPGSSTSRANNQIYRAASPGSGWLTYINANDYFVTINETSATDDAGNTQIFVPFMGTRAVRPFNNFAFYDPSSISDYSSFTATLVGSTSRTYLATGIYGVGYFACSYAGTGIRYGIAAIWE